MRVEFEQVAEPAEEPVEEKRPKTFHVRVRYDPADESYTASWGTQHHYTGGSMATALRLLANVLEAEKLHGSAEEHLRDLRVRPHTFCKYCEAPIFFGVVPSGKFLAFDPEPVNSTDVDGLRGASFSNRMDARGRPHVAWALNAKGPVWIPHPETCGQRIDEPVYDVLRVVWAANRTKTVEKKERSLAEAEAGAREIWNEMGAAA